jgi:hypothetical protein
MSRGLGIVLAVVFGSTGAANAQPTANAIATAETALFCGEVMRRADELANFALYAEGEQRAYDTDLDMIETRFVTPLASVSEQAGYSAEKLEERRAVHRASVNSMTNSALVAQTSMCGNKVSLQPTDTTMPPKTVMSLALGGRSKTDVMFVDMNSLDRLGPAISGWQLYVFKADQDVGGKPSKGQWTRFAVDCINPAIVTYGAVGLADLKNDKPYTADTRASPDIKTLQPNTFGAAAWMLACGVTQPGATHASLGAAADFSVGQFVQ